MRKLFVVIEICFVIFFVFQSDVFSFGGLVQNENDLSGREAPVSNDILINLRIPLFSPLFSNIPVALVNGEAITLDDLKNSLGSIHEDVSEKKGPADKNFNEIINRLVNVKLILQEARDIGLYDLQDVTKMIDSYSEELLIEMVQERRVKDLKADDAEVDNLYKKEVKELKIKSVLFEKEEDAKKMIEEIKNGKNFDEIAQTLISNETAKGDIDGTYLREKELQPNVFKAVSEMEIGGISSIVPVIKGFSIFKLEETRFPEDAGIKEKITNEVLNRKKVQVLIEYNSELLKKYVKINQKLVDKIDFEALKPGFEELLKDNRIVAEIEGGDKVTVGQWADAIKQKYFHGADRAIERKRVNKNKYEVLEKIIVKKALIIEASKAGIDKTEEYTNMIKGYGDSLVFNEFVKKAVAPNIKMNEEDKQKYYEDHKMEYAYSEMVKIDALGFENIDFAKSALKKLDSGAEFEWIKENAEGKLDNISDEILAIEGNVIATDSLPDDIKKALSGVKKGDFRLYEAADGFFYVFYIKEFYVAVPQPFEDVKDLITNKVVGEKLNSELRYWENKLREQSDIRIFFQSEASM